MHNPGLCTLSLLHIELCALHYLFDTLIVRYAQQFEQGCTVSEKDRKRHVGNSVPSSQRQSTWVQTERAAHEAWARLIKSSPTAARLAHVLVANLDRKSNAVVASQTTLAELMADPGERPMHRNSIRNAIRRLEADRWIEVVKIGGHGGALGYVVNDRIAWGQSRDGLRYSRFSARVVVSSSEQDQPLEDRPPLRQIPTIQRGEQQLPSGPGDDPPSQPPFDGMEPDLPAVFRDNDGLEWEVDKETGEAQQRIGGAGNE